MAYTGMFTAVRFPECVAPHMFVFVFDCTLGFELNALFLFYLFLDACLLLTLLLLLLLLLLLVTYIIVVDAVAVAVDVLLFVACVQGLRPSILSKLILSLREMVNGPVIAVAIWILGEYCEVCT